jgi:virginiamycin B lyase
VVDSKGTPFFCGFGVNKLASISPDTMAIKEYALPEGARPRRLAITPDDMVYYTDYARGRLGRLDPSTGKVEDWPSPAGSDSRPYGIAATPDGKVWYSESGADPNTVVGFDPKTRSFETWPVPSGGGVIRHMVSTPEGDLYIACSGKNKVGVVKISQGGRK